MNEPKPCVICARPTAGRTTVNGGSDPVCFQCFIGNTDATLLAVIRGEQNPRTALRSTTNRPPLRSPARL